MKRNIDHIGLILGIFESSSLANLEVSEIAVGALAAGQADGEIISHHLMLCIDKGLVASQPNSNTYRLTWAGHDYLEAGRKSGIF
ncbi:DUF2513 domain-containing protein [Burkholderia ubonensis]|uniref:DUF2513 domain-containing protein n=1 Tax=Burkholderia ubonensis TaxID=101571 RepID=UPI000ABDA0C5|nr:DUF2513 domain-containing protein [Burkholderia ubonensis]